MKKTREATLIFMLFAVFAAMFSVSSCNRENLIPENQNRSESEKMHPVRISMEGTLPVGAVKNKVFLIYPNIKNPSASEKAPCIDWSKNDTIDKVVFLLSDGSKHAVIKGFGVVSESKTQKGKYTIKLEGNGNTSYNVNSNTYVTVLLGAGEYGSYTDGGQDHDADFGNAHYMMADGYGLTQYGDVHNVGVLLTIPWQKANQKSGNFVDIRNLTFQPLGSLIGFKIKSEFVDPVRVRLVQFITNLYSQQFALDLNAAPQEGQLISYNASNFLRGDIGGVPHARYFLNNVPVRTAYNHLDDAQRASIENYVELNSETNDSLRFADWGLLLQPGAPGNSAPYFAAKFAMTRVCRDPFKGNDAWIKDTIEHQGFVVPYQRALWQAKNPHSLESGRSYYAEPTIKDAGLLITEVYYCQKDGKNYSMVEIYNPSNHDVDLSDYYIGRTIQACDVYGEDPENPEKGGTVSADYCYPEGKKGMVVCSLVPEEVRTLSDSGNVYKYYTENQGGYAIFYKGGDGAYYHKNTLVHIYNNNMKDIHKLAPGKTLLLAASGYVKDGHLLDNPHLPYGIKENQESIAAIVAIDNHGKYYRYANKNSSVQIGPEEPVNSTMDMDRDSGLLLMKVKNEGGKLTHEIVDIYNFGLAQKNLRQDYPAISSFYYASKYDGILYPEIYPTNSAEQYYISTNPDGNPISSFGARYRTPKSSNNQ